jgi:hypothetical protein
MRAFTLLLFVLTVITGCLAHYGVGALTETLKLTYAYLLLSTVACGLINLILPDRMPAPAQHRSERP